MQWQQRQHECGPSRHAHPQVPGAQQCGSGPCSLNFNDSPNPPSPFKTLFLCESGGQSPHKMCVHVYYGSKHMLHMCISDADQTLEGNGEVAMVASE